MATMLSVFLLTLFAGYIYLLAKSDREQQAMIFGISLLLLVVGLSSGLFHTLFLRG